VGVKGTAGTVRPDLAESLNKPIAMCSAHPDSDADLGVQEWPYLGKKGVQPLITATETGKIECASKMSCKGR
jgi:hypothetical protein